MRSIPLRTVEVTPASSKEPMPLKYADMIIGILGQPPQQRGMNLAEMQQAVSIIGTVRKADAEAKTSVLIEDVDWGYLSRRLEEFTGWLFADAAVVEFGQAIREAQPVDANEIAKDA